MSNAGENAAYANGYHAALDDVALLAPIMAAFDREALDQLNQLISNLRRGDKSAQTTR